MAEYVPFPTGEHDVVDDQRLRRRLLGCFGLGGMSLAAFAVLALVAMSALGSIVSGCEFDVGSGRVGDPGKGTDSARLPVTVSPRSGLTDGTIVRITSGAFDADQIVGVTTCLRSADTARRGLDACDETKGARYGVDADGRLDATYPVPRIITVGAKAYDCAAQPSRCLVVAADAWDYDQSGGQPVSFASGLPAADLTAQYERAVSDHLPVGSQPSTEAGPVAPGTELRVLASGFQPGEPLLVAYCTPAMEDDGLIGSCEPLDVEDAVSAIAFHGLKGDFVRADGSGAFTTSLAAHPFVTPFGDDISKALDAFDAGSTTTTDVPGPDAVACTATEGGCSIVIAAAADTKRSAVLPYRVTG